MLNRASIIGRIGQDVQLRYSQNGEAICRLSVATDESYTDKQGQKVQRTEWHTASVFGRMAENCANYLAKGSLVYVEGSLTTRKWTDKQGQDRYTTEIKAQRVQFLDRKQDNQGQAQGQQNNQYQQQQAPQQHKNTYQDDDQLPF